MLRRACVCLVMLAVMKLGVGMLIGNAGCEARQNVGVNIAGERDAREEVMMMLVKMYCVRKERKRNNDENNNSNNENENKKTEKKRKHEDLEEREQEQEDQGERKHEKKEENQEDQEEQKHED